MLVPAWAVGVSVRYFIFGGLTYLHNLDVKMDGFSGEGVVGIYLGTVAPRFDDGHGALAFTGIQLGQHARSWPGFALARQYQVFHGHALDIFGVVQAVGVLWIEADVQGVSD